MNSGIAFQVTTKKEANIKNTITFFLKILVAGGLIYWLYYQGKLDFGQLEKFVSQPSVLLFAFINWIITAGFLTTVRWFLLLRAAGYKIPFFRAFRLQLIGYFFNVAMPGAVGGDLIKIVYLAKEDKAKGGVIATMSILVDRAIGFLGLFLFGIVAILFNLSMFLATPTLRSLVLSICLIFLFLCLVFLMMFVKFTEGKDPFLRLFSWKIPGFSLARSIYLAFKQYSGAKKYIFVNIMLSFVIQMINFSYFLFLTYTINGSVANVWALATIYPLGLLATALPISPGGLGVGHMVFEELFRMIGLSNGANVYNLCILSLWPIGLVLGGISYLLKRDTSQNLN